MSALEIRRLSAGRGICETCLLEKGPSRSALFQVFLCGHPADLCCQVHQGKWRELFGEKS